MNQCTRFRRYGNLSPKGRAEPKAPQPSCGPGPCFSCPARNLPSLLDPDYLRTALGRPFGAKGSRKPYCRGSSNSRFFWCINEITTLAVCSVFHWSLVMGKLKMASPSTDCPGLRVMSRWIGSARR